MNEKLETVRSCFFEGETERERERLGTSRMERSLESKFHSFFPVDSVQPMIT